ncbi:hypothetical protein J2S13_000298 [Oikeobacillus pervagus]|uniref:Uncharacterized protein n=1 Tax=Oikeobacillus pervagus TaxID=1325931 RepID=A0AAJ1SWI1_9BACI|nr:hypothetical protein [Oikeobacillus pervagus]MDQ0213904.1 hypothetical protein [Oikeobacillus pervagus]
MDERKRMIIKEILLWKENRMLPEQYCDYLPALYCEEAVVQNHLASVNKQNWKKNWWQLLFLLMIPISLFVIYFTELSFFLQTAILTSFVVILLFACIYFTKKGLFYRFSR